VLVLEVLVPEVLRGAGGAGAEMLEGLVLKVRVLVRVLVPGWLQGG
jgi:hypothetical protein